MANDPTPDMIRAIRKGCETAFCEPCFYPLCTHEDSNYWCRRIDSFMAPALTEIAEPSAEMLATAANRPTSQLTAKALWRAMMRKVLGESDDRAD